MILSSRKGRRQAVDHRLYYQDGRDCLQDGPGAELRQNGHHPQFDAVHVTPIVFGADHEGLSNISKEIAGGEGSRRQAKSAGVPGRHLERGHVRRDALFYRHQPALELYSSVFVLFLASVPRPWTISQKIRPRPEEVKIKMVRFVKTAAL
ncbi:uncharacterized protein LOC120419813 [Culex pipiens pallens]|uniref:uncharacterized protein LOC120419813 n=1 Tax=Culex pipiens pallens TaxID=42434 RepID=UPI001953CFC9|nr:uncharacterized protein LOC120419813 [Culex pipiens pallens]